MASEVAAGTFWQAIVDHVTGPPLHPCSTRSRPLADPHADPGLTRLGVTATLGLLLLSPAWRAPRRWSQPALPASPLAVSEREGW